jgi:hypothetical protein
MMRPLCRFDQKFLTALLCGIWVALSLSVPAIQAQQSTERFCADDCLSAAVQNSLPCSGGSVEASSNRETPASHRCDLLRFTNIAGWRLHDPSFGSPLSQSLAGRRVFQPTLFELGIALRL